MKKLISLITVIVLGMLSVNLAYASDSTVVNDAQSNATIGFANKQKEDVVVPGTSSDVTPGSSTENPSTEKKVLGVLPASGENLGILLLLLGVLVIIIVFRRELKEIIGDKKINKRSF